MKQWLKKAIANPWLKQYILIGYAAKGTVYLAIGIFAVQAAVIPQEQALGTYLSLAWLADQLWGKLLVALIAVALTGYVWRRLFQAILVSSAPDFNFKHLVKCIGYIMSALSYAGVVYSAFNIVLEVGEDDDMIEDLASQLFDHPIGEWLILLGGIAVTIIGCSYIYGAKSGSYISEFQSDELHHQLEKWATRIGKIGVAARGIAFILTGIFLIQSAILGDSEFAGGLQNAFRLLETKSFGSLWLGLIGLGLICYGLYMYVATGYRRYAVR